MRKIVNGKNMVLGTCYYPEHWPKELWREDLERMLNVGIEVVRVGEFAWSKIERTEGKYSFAFFDEFLDLAEEVGMKVIFGTPTATPPAWLTTKYPEVLNARMDGVLLRHGARRHYNYNSKVYQKFATEITERLAQHYAKRSCIIGWQIDNELNCETAEFYSESDTLAFREFLKEKYDTLDALNDAWGTVFWNQTYTAWEEIFVPRTTISNSTNPHEVLDYTRFISLSARKFAKMQSDILRKYIKKDDFITTNGLFGNLDNHKMNQESLDFFTYDSYPNFAYFLDGYSEEAKDLRDRKWSRNLAEVRSISPNFGIMEQQSGANGWNTSMEAPAPRPGQLTLWTMQSIAHGADFISYFRWRTAIMGTEIYWHGILDYSGRDNRRLKEVARVKEYMDNMQDIAGTLYEARVGIIKDYDNIWDAQLDVWHRRVEKQSQKALFEAAQLTHTPFDYIYIDHVESQEDLSKYKVLFYPHPTMITKERVALLEEYVEHGGILVVGCRSAYKDMTGKCVMEKLPGLLQELSGTDVLEYTFIAPDAGKVMIDWEGRSMQASQFVDIVENIGENSKVEGRYTSDYYAGSGAIVSNSYGKGKMYYYGSAFNQESASIFLEKLGVSNPYGDIVQLPKECEIAVRKKEQTAYMFLLNYAPYTVEINLQKEATSMLDGSKLCGNIILQAYEPLVIKLESF